MVNRIETYDGEVVTFKHHDKKDGKEKSETVSVEAFIIRFICHIPDEQFKTIGHYGYIQDEQRIRTKKY